MLIAAIGVLAVASNPAAAGTGRLSKLGTPTESLGPHYWETSFRGLGTRSDGGVVTQWEDQLESFLANGAPDPASPPRQLPRYARWLPLASGKSLVLDEGKLTRLNADGSVDASFGSTGKIEAAAEPQAAAELPSGKILLAGTGSGGTHTRFSWVSVESVGADGSVDPGGGELQLSLPDATGVYAITPSGDGGALVVGGDFLLELRADGTPNSSFGSGGLVIHNGLKLAGGRVLPDGSVAAVGSGPGASDKDLLYLRFTAAGKPDPSFGTNGVRVFDLGGKEEAGTASWAPDGSVVVAGATQPPGSCFEVVGCEETPILVGFDSAGNLDPGFATGGVLRLDGLRGLSNGLYGSGVKSLARRPDGSIVAAGSSPPLETTAFLAAVSPQGTLLSGFGEGGIVRQRRSSPATQSIAGIAPAGDGKVLVAGISDVGAENTPVLIRYAADGRLDRSFGGGAGFAAIGTARFVNGFAVDRSGHLLTTLYGYPHATLVEVRTADGTRESSFGSDGSVLLPGRIFVEALGYAADGGPVVAGTHDVGGPAEPGVLLRYRPNGKPDRGFGKDGRVDLLAPGKQRMKVRALATDRKGRVLVAGFLRDRFALARMLPDGRPDPRFGSRGWALASTGGRPLTSGGGAPRPVALSLAGSHIYLAGATREGDRLRLVLLRFSADGRLDHSFGRGGRRTASISEAAAPTAIVPTPHGVLVVLNRGRRPLVTFARSKVRQQPLGDGRQSTNVRAALSRGRLLLGWTATPRGTGSGVFYLGERPLGGR